MALRAQRIVIERFRRELIANIPTIRFNGFIGSISLEGAGGLRQATSLSKLFVFFVEARRAQP